MEGSTMYKERLAVGHSALSMGLGMQGSLNGGGVGMSCLDHTSSSGDWRALPRVRFVLVRRQIAPVILALSASTVLGKTMQGRNCALES